nr:hypothetical protein [Tanacetum cinerariifolium]
THNSASPFNTIIPNDADLTTGGNGLVLESINRARNNTDHNLENMEDTTEVNSPFCRRHVMISSSGGSGRQAFSQHNPGGDGIGSPLRANVGLPVPFVLAWNLTTHSILYDAESCQDKMINLATPAVRDQQNQQELREREERIKQLEADLASITYSLTKVEVTVNILKGDLECLTMDLSHTEIVRHSEEDAEEILGSATDYDPECKTTFMSAFDSLSTKSYPYVKNLVKFFQLPLEDLQNMWPEREGLIVGRFCSVFGHLALGPIRDVLHFEKCSSLGHWHLDSSGTSCASGGVRHLAIGAWTHPKRLAFWEMFVTWPLALGLIWNGLRSRKCSSLGLIRNVLCSKKCSLLGHCRLDSSGMSCALGSVRHLAIGTWTHMEHLALRKEIHVEAQLVLVLIFPNHYGSVSGHSYLCRYHGFTSVCKAERRFVVALF